MPVRRSPDWALRTRVGGLVEVAPTRVSTELPAIARLTTPQLLVSPWLGKDERPSVGLGLIDAALVRRSGRQMSSMIHPSSLSKNCDGRPPGSGSRNERYSPKPHPPPV